jgi:protein-arginine kinase activator protein McsA
MKSCDSCQQQPATSYVTVTIEGVTRGMDVCNECFERVAPPEARAFAAAAKASKVAICHYCGGQPCWERPDAFGGLIGEKRRRFICTPCYTEYHRTTRLRLDGFAKPFNTHAEFIAEVRGMRREVERHMREWVAKRNL